MREKSKQVTPSLTWLQKYAEQLGVPMPEHDYVEDEPFLTYGDYTFTIQGEFSLKITKTFSVARFATPSRHQNIVWLFVHSEDVNIHISKHLGRLDHMEREVMKANERRDYLETAPIIFTVEQSWKQGHAPDHLANAELRNLLSYYDIIHTHVYTMGGEIINRVFTMKLKGE